MKPTYAAQDKYQDQQNKGANSGYSHAHTTYNHSGQKAEINAMVHQASDSTIALFVKNDNASNKRKTEAKINNID